MKLSSFVFSGLLLLSLTSWSQSTSLNLYFGYDLYQLTSEHKSELQSFFDQLPCDSFQVTVVGHTDNHASDAYNVALSQRRTSAAIAELERIGVQSEWIQEDHKGEFVPVANNELDEGRAKNRRVEIVVTSCSDEHEYGTMADLLKRIELKPSVAVVQVDKDTAFYLPKGTFVSIEANSFLGSNGSVLKNGEVEIFTREVYSYGDMIRANVVTQTKDKTLQTGGMVEIYAVQDGDTLEFAKALTLGMAVDDDMSDAGLFAGTDNAHDGEPIYWDNVNFGGVFMPMSFQCYNELRTQIQYPDCNFFCRMGRFMRGDSWRPEPRITQRGSFRGRANQTPCESDTLLALMNYYRVTNAEWALDSIFKDEYIKYGVDNVIDYYNAVRTEKMNIAAARMRNGTATQADLNFVFPVPNPGWYNCDRYTNYPNNAITSAKIVHPEMENIWMSVRVILSEERMCISGTYIGQTTIQSLPFLKDQDIEVFAMMMKDRHIEVANHRISNFRSGHIELEFVEVSEEELIDILDNLGKPSLLTSR